MRYPVIVDMATPAAFRAFRAHCKASGNAAAAGREAIIAGIAALATASAPPPPPPAEKPAPKRKRKKAT